MLIAIGEIGILTRFYDEGGNFMVTYRLVYFDGKNLVYEYFPQGVAEKPGVLTLDVENLTVQNVEMSEIDTVKEVELFGDQKKTVSAFLIPIAREIIGQLENGELLDYGEVVTDLA